MTIYDMEHNLRRDAATSAYILQRHHDGYQLIDMGGGAVEFQTAAPDFDAVRRFLRLAEEDACRCEIATVH